MELTAYEYVPHPCLLLASEMDLAGKGVVYNRMVALGPTNTRTFTTLIQIPPRVCIWVFALGFRSHLKRMYHGISKLEN